MRTVLLCLLVLYVALMACNSKQPNQWVDSDYVQGKKIYNLKCISCHRPYTINEFTDEKWKIILPDMYEKSNATTTEIYYIEYFVNHSKKKKSKIKEIKDLN